MRHLPVRALWAFASLTAIAALSLLPAGGAVRSRLSAVTSANEAANAFVFINTDASGGGLSGQVGPAPYGSTAKAGLFGVFAPSSAGAFGDGVVGLSSTGYGVVGEAISGAYSAVYGQDFSLFGGPGVQGVSAGNGVVGQSAKTNAVVGQTSNTNTNVTAAGILGQDLSTAGGDANVGVLGTTTSGEWGVEGTSGNGSSGGVFGVATTGNGVEGSTQTGTGVYGQSQTGFGVEGVNGNSTAGQPYQNEGVEGSSTVGPGVLAASSQGYGLYAFSGSNIGAFIESEGTAGAALTVEYAGATNDGRAVDVFNNNLGDIMALDASGNLTVAGTVTASAGAGTFSRTRNPSSDVALYAPQEAEAITEDVGSAQLVNGSATVALAADFRPTIDGSSAYMVFLTPDGDTNGLYVASRNSTGFVVREARGGHSTLAFDYRIVARPYGARMARLPRLSANARLALHSRNSSRVLPPRLLPGGPPQHIARRQSFAANYIPAAPVALHFRSQ
jgi:hypothetical protein